VAPLSVIDDHSCKVSRGSGKGIAAPHPSAYRRCDGDDCRMPRSRLDRRPFLREGIMRRIYFLLPNVKTARTIVDELLLARIEWRHVHVLARHDIELEDLPEATLAQKSDLLPSLARGAAAGGVSGMLAGLVALAFPPAGLTIAGGAVVAMTLAGAGFGSWVSSMIGVDVPNTRLKQFEQAIERGELLMMVDVPAARVDEIEAMVKRHHADADIEGTDPTIPAFP
jgi:hypothetical protein